NARVGLMQVAHPPVVLFLRDRAGLAKRACALCLDVRELALRLRELEVSLCALEVRLVRARVDDGERFALLDGLAFAKQHTVDVSGDSRPHLDRIYSLEAADVLIPIGDLAGQDLRDLDAGRWRLRRVSGLAATSDAHERRCERRGSAQSG